MTGQVDRYGQPGRERPPSGRLRDAAACGPGGRSRLGCRLVPAGAGGTPRRPSRSHRHHARRPICRPINHLRADRIGSGRAGHHGARPVATSHQGEEIPPAGPPPLPPLCSRRPRIQAVHPGGKELETSVQEEMAIQLARAAADGVREATPAHHHDVGVADPISCCRSSAMRPRAATPSPSRCESRRPAWITRCASMPGTPAPRSPSTVRSFNELTTLRFLDAHADVTIVGSVGVGKTSCPRTYRLPPRRHRARGPDRPDAQDAQARTSRSQRRSRAAETRRRRRPSA